MKVLVVGGTGFLGHHVVAELLRRGHQVSTLARRPAAHLPPEVKELRGDLATLPDPAELLRGHDGVVFAAGADDRTVPRRPAYPYFAAGNVTPVERLLTAGVPRVVVLGSYFTALHRAWPELDLPGRHPYIRSRLAQQRVALAGGAAVLEIPFVFGSAPGSRPLWAPLLPWLRSRAPLLAPTGGTAVVTAATVGRAAVGALEQGGVGACPLVDANLTWDDLLARLAVAAGRPRPVHRLPTGVLHTALLATGAVHAVRGCEPGLRSAELAALLTRELFLDPAACRALAGPAGAVDDSLRETVSACDERS